MTSEEFFRRLPKNREHTPAHFAPELWHQVELDMPWLEVIDRRIGIWDPDLVLEMPHRADQWESIHAMRAAGFSANMMAAPKPRFWLVTGARSGAQVTWRAALRELSSAGGPPRYAAEVSMTPGAENHRVEWTAMGGTPTAALEAALVRARAGVATLIALGAP